MDTAQEKYKDYSYSIYMTDTESLLKRLEQALPHQLNIADERTINDAIVYIRNHFFWGL